MQKAKTVAAFHDLSSVGRCALTVVIPIVSAFGVQVIPAPTAVLSAHTAFPTFVIHDLTDMLSRCVDAWIGMGVRFDCIYTGYFANVRQLETAARLIDAQPDAVRVIDPVMGDDGLLYKGMSEDMPERLKVLIDGADVITPNLTEAALLTGEAYYDGEFTLSHAERLVEKLMALGPKRCALTGVPMDGCHANLYCESDGVVRAIPYECIPAAFPGTGDLFASTLTGAVMRGFPFADAIRLASEHVSRAMRYTVDCGCDPLEGVQLEKTLHYLTEECERHAPAEL